MPAPKFIPHPRSAPGDFYVENEACITCGVPHVVAPDLMAWVDNEKSHCIWKKQPETLGELAQAIAVLHAQELGCHRYAGDDPAILTHLSAEHCDYPLPGQRKPRQMIQPASAADPFRLLDQKDSFLARIWKRLARKRES